MKTKYDLALPMGYACSCSQMVRAAGLQFASFPFDWAAPYGRYEVQILVQTVCDDFSDWFEKDDFTSMTQDDVGVWDTSEADAYINRRTGYFFPHDFPKGADFDQSFGTVAERYRRRIGRLQGLLKSAKRVLLVRMDSPALQYVTTAEECTDARARLMAKFPGVAFDVIYLTIDPTRPVARRLEEKVSEGVLHVAFDYVDRRPNAPGYLAKVNETAAVLAAHAKVCDYRTPEERREYDRKRHLQRWAKLGATTFWGYQVARIRKMFLK